MQQNRSQNQPSTLFVECWEDSGDVATNWELASLSVARVPEVEVVAVETASRTVLDCACF
jgi:hypothetical protein